MKKIRVAKTWTDSFEKVETALGDVETLNEFVLEGEASEEEVQVEYSTALQLLEELELKKNVERGRGPTLCHATNQSRCRRYRK